MKFIFVIFASLLISQAYGRIIPAVFDDTEDLTVDECVYASLCIAQQLNDAEFELDAENLLIVDIITSLIEIVQGYLGCQAILSDPPTRWEEIQHTTCMALWSAQSALTALRLQREISQASDNVRSSWARVQDTCTDGRPIVPCINHLLPPPETTEIVPY